MLPSCDLQKWHEEPVLPTRILSALQDTVEGSPAVSSGCSSSCVDVMAAHSDRVALLLPGISQIQARCHGFWKVWSLLHLLCLGTMDLIQSSGAVFHLNALEPVYKYLEFHWQKACGSTTAPLKKPGGKSTSITLLGETCS